MIPLRWLPLMDLFADHGAEHVYPATALRRGGSSIWLTTDGLDVFDTKYPAEYAEYSHIAIFDRADPAEVRAYWQDAAANGIIDSVTARYRIEYDQRAREFLDQGYEDFQIVVTHRPIDAGYDPGSPEGYDFVVAQAAASEQSSRPIDWEVNIAGHTHGGLWRLPLIGPLVHPNLGLFPPDEVTYGLHPDKDGHRRVWVSSGLAAKEPWYASFRVLNPPEIAVITLSQEP